MAIKLSVTVQADAATAACLAELQSTQKQILVELRRLVGDVAQVKGQTGGLVTDLNQLLTLIRVVDDRTSEIGSVVGRVATTNSAIAESQGKLALAIAEVGSDLQRLRDSLGGEGGLKPGEADQVRAALEAATTRLAPIAAQASDQADALAQQQVTLEAQATVLEQLGKDDTLIPPPTPAPVPVPQPEPTRVIEETLRPPQPVDETRPLDPVPTANPTPQAPANPVPDAPQE